MKRLIYAKAHKDWSDDQWKTGLWSDKSKFEIFKSNRKQYVRKRVGERWRIDSLQPSVKHVGESVLVWGCISASDVGNIVQIYGLNMNTQKYTQDLIHHTIPNKKNA